jgi:hypothetical protein
MGTGVNQWWEISHHQCKGFGPLHLYVYSVHVYTCIFFEMIVNTGITTAIVANAVFTILFFFLSIIFLSSVRLFSFLFKESPIIFKPLSRIDIPGDIGKEVLHWTECTVDRNVLPLSPFYLISPIFFSKINAFF